MARKKEAITVIPERVRELLRKQGRTQLEMASDIKYDKDHINKCLNKREISEDILIQIAQYLDCNPAYLSIESATFSPYASYKGYQYSATECIRGLLHMMNYSPSDYTKDELQDLQYILGRTVDIFSTQKGKTPYNPTLFVYWDGEGDRAGTANVYFDKKSDDKKE